MTGIEPALSAWEAGEPTSQVVFQAQTWPFEGTFGGLIGGLGARGGPEHLINMATCQHCRHLRHEAAAAPPMATPVPQTTPWTIATEPAGSERAFTERKECPSARRQNPSPPMHAATGRGCVDLANLAYTRRAGLGRGLGA